MFIHIPMQVVSLSDYDYVQEVTKENSKKSPSPGYPLVCVTPCDPHYPKYSVMRERCEEAGINQTSVHFSWEVAAPTDSSGSRSPFETVTDNTPYTTINHMVCPQIFFNVISIYKMHNLVHYLEDSYLIVPLIMVSDKII